MWGVKFIRRSSIAIQFSSEPDGVLIMRRSSIAVIVISFMLPAAAQSNQPAEIPRPPVTPETRIGAVSTGQYIVGLTTSDAISPAHRFAVARLQQRQFGEAAIVLDTLVAKGDVWAAMQLARLYSHGLGVGRDEDRALMLLEFGAQLGNAEAALAAGVARARGIGGAANSILATQWLRQAIETGNQHVRRDARSILSSLGQ